MNNIETPKTEKKKLKSQITEKILKLKYRKIKKLENWEIEKYVGKSKN